MNIDKPVSKQRPNRKVSYRISTLLLSIGIVGVATALVARRHDYAHSQAVVARAVAKSNNSNGLSYSYEFNDDGKWLKKAQPYYPDFLSRLVGKDFLYSAEGLDLCEAELDEDLLRHIGRLRNLRELMLVQCSLTSKDMAHLQQLQKLKHLDVLCNRIGDEGLQHVGNLTQLEHLDVQYQEIGHQITDAGLHHLSKLENLKQLRLSGNLITDAGVRAIGCLQNLEVVVLVNTPVSQKGAAELRQLVPGCLVHIDK